MLSPWPESDVAGETGLQTSEQADDACAESRSR
jgi:hypothetical protein